MLILAVKGMHRQMMQSTQGKEDNASFDVFTKTGEGNLFETEAEGLRRLSIAAQGYIRVPRVVFAKNNVEIKMEKLQLVQPSSRKHAVKMLARGLRHIHEAPQPDEDGFKGLFGFPLPGQCGALKHPNNCERKPCDWVAFFAEFRLGYQLNVLRSKEHRSRTVSRVIDDTARILSSIDEFFEGKGVQRTEIRPSLLHGDLWEGNWGVVREDDKEVVALFDPAPLYGHFEYDFGIGTMFGGPICADFYEEYFSSEPRPSGFKERVLLYSLFHHLNHMNIFGTETYAGGALSALNALTSHLRST